MRGLPASLYRLGWFAFPCLGFDMLHLWVAPDDALSFIKE